MTERRRVCDYTCILVLNINTAGFQHKTPIFFKNYVNWISLIFFRDFGCIHDYFGTKNLIPWMVFMILEEKLIPHWSPAVFTKHENQKIET